MRDVARKLNSAAQFGRVGDGQRANRLEEEEVKTQGCGDGGDCRFDEAPSTGDGQYEQEVGEADCRRVDAGQKTGADDGDDCHTSKRRAIVAQRSSAFRSSG